MRLDNAVTVAKREYLARLRTKGFWLATVALPLFIGAMGVVPALLLGKGDKAHRLAVVDATGRLGEALARELAESDGPLGERAAFDVELVPAGADARADAEALDRRVLDDEIDAWIRIDDASLAADEIAYNAESVSNFITQSALERALSRVVRHDRLTAAGYDADEVGTLARGVGLDTVRVSEEGSKSEGAEAGIILAYVLFFILYMVLIIYGQQVMNGVLEEKSSRIVEVIVSTTRPFELMLGKLGGICLVALTQLAIWMGTLVLLTLPGVVASMAWVPENVDIPSFTPAILLHFLGHFLLGFFLYSTLYAAIGASFNNVQEAQQFASVAVIFLIAPVFLFWKVLNDPDSTLSVVSSLVPLFSPLLMMLRIAVKTPPWWQITLSYLLTALFTLAMVWLSARIYRVGILMYGKKPTIQELWRWIRYA